MRYTEREAYIVLNGMERVGPVRVRAMAEQLGSVPAILEASADDLQQADGVGPALSTAILRQRAEMDPAQEDQRAADRGVRILTPVDDEYPAALRNIHDPPMALYIRGRLKPVDREAMAIVGTRHPTHYGQECAYKLAYGLAKAGLCVCSGLALGVDTAAHEGALRAGGRTVAVLGGGFDHVYPQENVALTDQIAEQGAVLSEFPFARKPDRTTFPMRNRIVSGMTRGTLVVEAGLGSGAMITASLATSQGRSVFALPGRIDSYASSGPNALIKDGAYVVTEIRDVLEHFEMLFPVNEPDRRAGGAPERHRPGLNATEEQVVRLLAGGERGVDALIREAGVAPSAMASLLIGLELKKVIKMLPGRNVALIH